MIEARIVLGTLKALRNGPAPIGSQCKFGQIGRFGPEDDVKGKSVVSPRKWPGRMGKKPWELTPAPPFLWRLAAGDFRRDDRALLPVVRLWPMPAHLSRPQIARLTTVSGTAIRTWVRSGLVAGAQRSRAPRQA